MLQETFDRQVSRSVASRVLIKMGWSWKVPTRFQIAKYSVVNLERYVDYLEWVQSVEDWTQLKYCDESHIVPQKLTSRKVLGLVNRRVYVPDSTLNQARASITLMTSLTEDDGIPFIFNYRIESNDQWDFLEFLLTACENGSLCFGDFLILDNAAVHGGMDSFELLMDIIEYFGIRLIYLPAYSPELNPCELVFSLMKQAIRGCPSSELPDILERVLQGLAVVTPSKVLAFYKHCIYPPVILPDLFL